MIISDGTTNLTFTGTMTDDFPVIEQSSTRTAGGQTRTVRAGRRFTVSERIRVTGDELESLIDLLTNGAEDYFYTPTVVPDYMSSTDFPMSVEIDVPKKTGIDGGGTKRYYVTLRMVGADFI